MINGCDLSPDRTVLKVSKPKHCSIIHVQSHEVVLKFSDGASMKVDSFRRRHKPDPRPLSGEELQERLQAEAVKHQKEREQRTEAKRQRRQQEAGMDVSTEDIIAEEEREKQESRERGKASRAPGMRRPRRTPFIGTSARSCSTTI